MQWDKSQRAEWTPGWKEEANGGSKWRESRTCCWLPERGKFHEVIFNLISFTRTFLHLDCLLICNLKFGKTCAIAIIVFFRQYVGLPPDIKLAMGHKLTDGSMFGITVNGMLRACTYRGSSCLNEEWDFSSAHLLFDVLSFTISRMWIPYPTASYGTCYTYNSATNAEDTNVPRISSLTGSANGLTLEIYLDQVNKWLHHR